MKKFEYARNRSSGRNWAYHKKEEMYLKKLEMKQSMTEFLNRVKKAETPPLHFIQTNEVEGGGGGEEGKMKLAERYEDNSFLFNYGAVITEDDIIEMERRKNFNQKRPNTRSSTLKSDSSNNELNSKINLYFLHQNCGNCIRLRVNGTLVPEYFVRRSFFPSTSSSSSSFSSSSRSPTTSLHYSLPSFYITPPSSTSSSSSSSSSSFPASSIPCLTLNSSSSPPLCSSSIPATSSPSSSSYSSSCPKRKRRQSSRIISKNTSLKNDDEDDNDGSYDANTDRCDNTNKNNSCDDGNVKVNSDSTTHDNNGDNVDSNNTDTDTLGDIKKNRNTINDYTNVNYYQDKHKKKNTRTAVNMNKMEEKGSKRGGFLLESCWALCTLHHRTH